MYRCQIEEEWRFSQLWRLGFSLSWQPCLHRTTSLSIGLQKDNLLTEELDDRRSKGLNPINKCDISPRSILSTSESRLHFMVEYSLESGHVYVNIPSFKDINDNLHQSAHCQRNHRLNDGSRGSHPPVSMMCLQRGYAGGWSIRPSVIILFVAKPLFFAAHTLMISYALSQVV